MTTPISLVCFDLGGVVVRICRSWAEGCAEAGLDVRGDVEEALTRFADLADLRRRAGFGDDDPQRVYAEQQIARIRDHETKRVWTDRFDRATRDVSNHLSPPWST